MESGEGVSRGKRDATLSGGIAMSHKPKNMARSVFERLNNRAKERDENHEHLRVRYANERLLYRLSKSPYANQFILKGGTLLLAWLIDNPHRVTQDIDFLALMPPTIDGITVVFEHLCTMLVDEDDGIVFLLDTMNVTELPSAIRVELKAKIDKADPKLSIDIGYGDVITPEIQNITYPVLLPTMPAPKLQAYPKYTVVAEKFEAIIDLEMRNTRYKDFYDIWFICTHYGFEGALLKTAIERTFANRKTPIPTDIPIVFTSEFYADKTRKSQWQSFIKKDKALINPEFENVIHEMSNFLMPIVQAILQQQSFPSKWNHQSLMWQ
ncbi:MAG: nucleotidyl transferase AbiEii/AbiGii toxin family protein [bacterium]|nr:nucleotidyl transferase AbiEii/AbiGii toxin family protein [bacterium]